MKHTIGACATAAACGVVVFAVLVLAHGCGDTEPGAAAPGANLGPAQPPTTAPAQPPPTKPEYSSSRPAPAEAPESQEAAEREPLAVVPFDVLGHVTVPDAGSIIAEKLLPHFQRRYLLVDQAQLARFADQADLTLAGLAKAAKGQRPTVKLTGVRYLVVGSVSGSPNGTYSLVARMTDWRSGQVVQGRLAQVSAADWDSLLEALPLLAGQLSGEIDARMFDEGLVRLDKGRLVVRTIATGKNELEQLQTARRLSRAAFARYARETLQLTTPTDELLKFARDKEKILDAQTRGNAMIYEVSFPLPKGK